MRLQLIRPCGVKLAFHLVLSLVLRRLLTAPLPLLLSLLDCWMAEKSVASLGSGP